MSDEQLVTTTQAAKELGISRSTLAAYARNGVLRPALRLPSGQLRWRLADVLRQIRELDTRSGEQP